MKERKLITHKVPHKRSTPWRAMFSAVEQQRHTWPINCSDHRFHTMIVAILVIFAMLSQIAVSNGKGVGVPPAGSRGSKPPKTQLPHAAAVQGMKERVLITSSASAGVHIFYYFRWFPDRDQLYWHCRYRYVFDRHVRTPITSQTPAPKENIRSFLVCNSVCCPKQLNCVTTSSNL
jgi:hypothetical protein